MRHSTILALLAGVGLALVSSCGGPTRFLDPEADIPFYERVGIIPFTTLAQDRAGGYKVTDVFFSELLRTGFAEVAEPGQFHAAMVRLRGGTTPEKPWSTEELNRLGETARVQGVFLGTVREYGTLQKGRETVPLLSLEVRLVDTATGRLVWSASTDRAGSAGLPVLGWGKDRTMSSVTTEVCRSLLGTLPRYGS